ncbi:MAG TPA: hypothetical protein VJ824_12840 [Bacillota bacterium]|nr:hypothetical protein [Bacillota bacterium]
MRIFSKVKGTIDSATRKSQDAIEINKLNNQIKKQEQEMEKLFRLIGEKVFNDSEFRKQDTKSYVDVQIKNIQHVKNQIQSMQRKVYFLKDLIECDSCAKILPIRTKYCPDCGRNIAELAKSVAKQLATEQIHD